jgi:hypothetical protein
MKRLTHQGDAEHQLQWQDERKLKEKKIRGKMRWGVVVKPYSEAVLGEYGCQLILSANKLKSFHWKENYNLCKLEHHSNH